VDALLAPINEADVDVPEVVLREFPWQTLETHNGRAARRTNTGDHV
jgi:hypothetical protein